MKAFFSKLKINMPVRFRNFYFWVALLATVLAAMGVSPEMFTSWDLVWEALVGLVSNPFQLGCVVLAIAGVINDPTTSGIGDSDQALTYTHPRK